MSSIINRAIIAELNQMRKTLDNLQKNKRIQGNHGIIDELGETMGHINNAIGVIKNGKRFKSQLLMYELGETMGHIDNVNDAIRNRKRRKNRW